jgi:hypothetical protein
MRVIIPTLVTLAATSAQAVPSPNNETLLAFGPPLSLGLGDQACGEGLHQALWRNWCWVCAYPIDDLAALGRRLNGVDA